MKLRPSNVNGNETQTKQCEWEWNLDQAMWMGMKLRPSNVNGNETQVRQWELERKSGEVMGMIIKLNKGKKGNKIGNESEEWQIEARHWVLESVELVKCL